MRKKSFVVMARSPAKRGTTQQSDKLLKSLKASFATLAMTCLWAFPQPAKTQNHFSYFINDFGFLFGPCILVFGF
jgi:hypothetical protein